MIRSSFIGACAPSLLCGTLACAYANDSADAGVATASDSAGPSSGDDTAV